MFNPIKLLRNISTDIKEILSFLGKMNTRADDALVDLNRHQIGSIDLNDIVESDMLKGSERKEYLRKAELLWEDEVFQNETKRIIRLQLEFIGMHSQNFEQTLVGRGTINGSDLLRERIEKLHVEYKELTSPQEDFDKFEVSV